MSRRRALIFDYDGLILDTESATFEVWREFYRDEGAELRLSDWLQAVGHVDNFDPRTHLERQNGRSYHWERVQAALRERIWRRIAGRAPLDGVADLIARGRAAGWRIGVASNSDREWVRAGLESCGLLGRIDAIRARDDVVRHKPHPEVYLAVLGALDCDAGRSIAFEDSAAGTVAAKACGLRVIAVPNPLTRHHDLSAADEIRHSLAGFEPPARADDPARQPRPAIRAGGREPA